MSHEMMAAVVCATIIACAIILLMIGCSQKTQIEDFTCIMRAHGEAMVLNCASDKSWEKWKAEHQGKES